MVRKYSLSLHTRLQLYWHVCYDQIKIFIKQSKTIYLIQPSSLWFKLTLHGLRAGDRFLANGVPVWAVLVRCQFFLSGTRSLTYVTINSKRRLYYLKVLHGTRVSLFIQSFPWGRISSRLTHVVMPIQLVLHLHDSVTNFLAVHNIWKLRWPYPSHWHWHW